MDIGGTTVFIIAAGCCFALLIVTASSYIRAANALMVCLRAGNWEALTEDPFRPPGASRAGEAIDVTQLILGIKQLSSKDAQSGKLLWEARWRIITCAFLLAAGVAAAGLAGARIY